jgi:hypothetical protein
VKGIAVKKVVAKKALRKKPAPKPKNQPDLERFKSLFHDLIEKRNQEAVKQFNELPASLKQIVLKKIAEYAANDVISSLRSYDSSDLDLSQEMKDMLDNDPDGSVEELYDELMWRPNGVSKNIDLYKQIYDQIASEELEKVLADEG